MKILKILGFIGLGLLSVILVVGFLSPSEFEASAAKVIEAPSQVVYAQCADLEKRHQWSPWEQMDSTMTITTGEISVGEGASYSWESASQGNGSLTYTKAVPNELLVSSLNFGTESDAEGIMTFEEAPEGTKVTWTMKADLGSNPFSRLMYRLLKPSMEAMFSIGLDNLAEMAENAEVAPMVEVEVVEWEGGLFLTMMDSSSFETMDSVMAMGYGSLVGELQANNAAPAGAAVCFYHKWDEENGFAVYEMGFPISEEFVASDRFAVVKKDATKVARTVHRGDYDSMDKSWEGLMGHIESNEMQYAGAPWEEYVVNMRADSNSANWVTNISFPVQ